MIWNWLSRRPLLVDVTVVALLLFVAIVTAAHRGDGVTGIGLGVAETLPLLYRRQRPILVLGAVTAVALVMVELRIARVLGFVRSPRPCAASTAGLTAL